jgi:hypothetical protein
MRTRNVFANYFIQMPYRHNFCSSNPLFHISVPDAASHDLYLHFCLQPLLPTRYNAAFS